jgi:diguanylate cyclase (GGDEF)-like protein
MACHFPDPPVPTLGGEGLNRLMPLGLWLGCDGRIRAAGPTLVKLFPGQALVGGALEEFFECLHPRSVSSIARPSAGGLVGLKLVQRAPPRTGFRGLAVPLPAGQGAFVNLCFGIDVARAVRDHGLTQSDFAATDLTVEMLYLIEAKTAVMDELRSLNMRLREAKLFAEQLALTDTLTGLHNRRAMDEVLAGATRARLPFGLMHVDLDHFKQINDTLGHAAGDRVLSTVARILREETRAGDTVARVGGDEFVLVLPELSGPDALEQIARRIIARLEEPIPFGDEICRISASIGMTSSEVYATPQPDRILSDADRALYASKHGGRGRATMFAPGMPSSGVVAAEGPARPRPA